MLTRIALLLCALSLSCLTMAQDQDSGVRELLRLHNQTLDAHDLDGLMALYANDETIVLLGTGPGERWLGQESIRAAYQQFMNDFDPGTTDNHCTWSSIGNHGDTAWISAMCQVTDYLANVKREFPLNLSAVMVRDGEQWRFQTMHFSNLTDQ